VLPEFGIPVCESKLHHRAAYKQAALDGQSVHAGGSRAKRAVEEVEALTNEVTSLLHPTKSRRVPSGGKG
jgi:chromosome partitioning protein